MYAAGNEQELDFPINNALLEDATLAMEEWRTIRDRLSRIEDQKEQVSQAVHERVKKDYENRLEEATDRLLSKKGDIDSELRSLYGTKERIEGQLDEHRQALEEVKFRNTLGEYEEDEYQQRSKDAQEKISKFEAVINAVGNNIERYESIFAGEEDIFAPQEIASPEEDISEVMEISNAAATPLEVEPPTDDSGYLLDDEGPNYFEAPAEEPLEDTLHGELGIEDSQTAKSEVDMEAAAQDVPEEPRPRIVVINGENAGAAYPVKGTTSFGRAETSTIPVKDAKASRQHSQIQKHGNEYVLVDLNSSNGTYVNGEKVEEHVLSNGDEIMIGDMIYQYQFEN